MCPILYPIVSPLNLQVFCKRSPFLCKKPHDCQIFDDFCLLCIVVKRLNPFNLHFFGYTQKGHCTRKAFLDSWYAAPLWAGTYWEFANSSQCVAVIGYYQIDAGKTMP
jgi:hypothetical protein